MDKKGDMQRLLSWIIYLIFVLVLVIALSFFINTSASGELAKKQILAKQIALLIDSARPGTIATINKEDFSISISGNIINVKGKKDIVGYDYDFFSPYNIKFETVGNTLKIYVDEK